MIRNAVLFVGDDASGFRGIWETDGTAAGIQELVGRIPSCDFVSRQHLRLQAYR